MSTRIHPTRWIDAAGAIVPSDGIAEDDALGAGLVGVSGSFEEGWDIRRNPDVPLTAATCEAVSACVRDRERGVPLPAREILSAMRRSAWDADRDRTVEDGLERAADRIAQFRQATATLAVAAAAIEAGALPDVGRIERAAAKAVMGIEDAYQAAHAWRRGPPPWKPGAPDLRDAAGLRAGTAWTVAALKAERDRLRDLHAEMTAALYGIDVAEMPARIQEPWRRQGENPAHALARLGDEKEALFTADGKRPPPLSLLPEGIAKPAQSLKYQISTVSMKASVLGSMAESFEVRSSRLDPDDAEGLRRLGGWLLAHEGGRTCLEVRFHLARNFPTFIAPLRAALEAHATPGGPGV